MNRTIRDVYGNTHISPNGDFQASAFTRKRKTEKDFSAN
jgi:hypothetical protein